MLVQCIHKNFKKFLGTSGTAKGHIICPMHSTYARTAKGPDIVGQCIHTIKNWITSGIAKGKNILSDAFEKYKNC